MATALASSIICGGLVIKHKLSAKDNEKPEIVEKNDGNTATEIIGGADEPTTIFFAGKLGEPGEDGYVSITMEQAKTIFVPDVEYSFKILDVRRADEFAEGHIPGAINVANEDIATEEPAELTDKEELIFVYCRSGRRSKEAAKKLVNMGYSNIVECGGILDWTGELVK